MKLASSLLTLLFIGGSLHAEPKLRAIVAPLEVKVQNVATTIATPSGNTTVAFLDLQQPTEFGSGLTEMLTTALVQSGRYVVLEGPSTALEGPSTALGAQVIVKGAVTEISFKRSGGGTNLASEIVDGTLAKSVATVAIDLRIVDVESGEILDSVRAVGKVGSKLMSLTLKDEDKQIGLASFDNGPLGLAVRSAVGEAVRLIGERTAKIPWEGRVAEVVQGEGGTSLYLNAGTQSGLEVGDVLDVYRMGQRIADPETGAAIGRTRGDVVGRCRIESVEPKLSIAVPVDGTGFAREDVVRLAHP